MLLIEFKNWWSTIRPAWKALLLKAAQVEVKDLDKKFTKILNLTEIDTHHDRSVHSLDLEPLRMLKKLRTVIVNDTKITDLEPLSELYALEKLELFSAKIKTLEPLKKLKKLKKLGLSKTKITNVTPLKNCTELSALTIIYSPIKNLSPLEKLKKLENLYFSLHPQFDLSSLRNLKNLKELLILARPKDKIDVQVLSKLTNLETLDFRGIISSLDGLKNLKKLKKFCCAPVYGNDELHRFIIQHPKCTVWHREMGIWNSREHRSYLKIIMKNKKNKL